MATKNTAKKEKFEKAVELKKERFEKAVEQKKERFERAVELKNERFEKAVEDRKERFEKSVEQKKDRLEKFKPTVVAWLRTSQLFDGMVNTPARIVINVLSMVVLYGWGFWVFATESGLLAWSITLLVLLLMQATSVRFVFSTEGVADELQLKRRDKALRMAYRAIRRNIVFAALIVMALVYLGERSSQDWYAYLFSRTGTFYMDNYRGLFLAIFAVAMMSFQKYFSYGMQGEPFTIRENRKIRD